jgi:hypothetical protein
MSDARPWRNRITGHGEEAPDQLLANPKNWRVHPKTQEDALSGVLGQVGWVASIIVNQRTGTVVDGHLRAAMAISHGDATVPVTYVDLTPDEEDLVLATFDPLSAAAVTDRAKLDSLLAGLPALDPALTALLQSTLAEAPETVSFTVEDRPECPTCGRKLRKGQVLASAPPA